MELTSGFVIYLFNAVLLRVGGTLSVAVYAIISNIAYVCKGIYNGIAQAMQPLVSVNCGAGNLARMQNARRLSQLAAAVFSIAATVLCLFFPEPIIAFFAGDDRQLIAQSIPALQLYFASLLFTGANTCIYTIFSPRRSPAMPRQFVRPRYRTAGAGADALTPLLGVNGVWLTVLFSEGELCFSPLGFHGLRTENRLPRRGWTVRA
ncbi:MAG: MATE family efflux transporter [Oscillospiraceae bacterium]